MYALDLVSALATKLSSISAELVENSLVITLSHGSAEMAGLILMMHCTNTGQCTDQHVSELSLVMVISLGSAETSLGLVRLIPLLTPPHCPPVCNDVHVGTYFKGNADVSLKVNSGLDRVAVC